jgi:butyryl-CoA dehydrogenase
VRRDDGYLINGKKTWASNCFNADYLETYIGTGDRKMCLIMVDAKLPGISMELRPRLGGNLITSGTVTYDNVVVPHECMITEDAYSLAMEIIELARINVAALAVGTAQRAIDATVAYLKERQTFGKPVIKNQYVQFKLAELQNKVEAARWFLYHCASQIDAGESLTIPAANVKLFCPEVAWEVTSECSHFFGGVGCEVNQEITRLMGNAKAMKIEDGTSEVQKMLLAKNLIK